MKVIIAILLAVLCIGIASADQLVTYHSGKHSVNEIIVSSYIDYGALNITGGEPENVGYILSLPIIATSGDAGQVAILYMPNNFDMQRALRW